VSIGLRGDLDGETVLASDGNVPDGVQSLSIKAGGKPRRVSRTGKKWQVAHEPGAWLEISYNLPESGPGIIDAGVPEQLRPIIHGGYFHVFGSTALLLPEGHKAEEPIKISLRMSAVAPGSKFVSSFGTGADLAGLATNWAGLRRSLFLGGKMTLSITDTGKGLVGIAATGIDSPNQTADLQDDVISIIRTERSFFNDNQPWYLVSVHGGATNNQKVIVGGGMGLSNSFAMFVSRRIDLSEVEHREHLRWVLAHEYFHTWNGLLIRVASKDGADTDDASNYWFSEGFTEFYAMRLLTRAGMQSPQRAVDVLNDKLRRYAKNKRRHLSAKAVGKLFWSDPDGEQVPYLRGYLAAWLVELGSAKLKREAKLDLIMRDLVKRAQMDRDARVDSNFLIRRFSQELTSEDARALSSFVLSGGELPLDEESFLPCLQGGKVGKAPALSLEFSFEDESKRNCFTH